MYNFTVHKSVLAHSFLQIVHDPRTDPRVGVVVLVPVAHTASLSDARDRGVRSSQLSKDVKPHRGRKKVQDTYHDLVMSIKEIS